MYDIPSQEDRNAEALAYAIEELRDELQELNRRVNLLSDKVFGITFDESEEDDQ